MLLKTKSQNHKVISVTLSVAISFLFVFAFATSTTTINSSGITTTGNSNFVNLTVTGTTTLAATTTINGVSYYWPNADGNNNQVLTTDSAGNLTWENPAFSQWTTDTGNIYFNTGNVGIGTTSPYAKLSIESTTGGTAPLFAIASSTAGAGTSTMFYVGANGNVGIGTAGPTSNLEINTGTISAGSNYGLYVHGTLDSTSANTYGPVVDFATAGSGSFRPVAMQIGLSAGYTGSGFTRGAHIYNNTAGTSTFSHATYSGNIGALVSNNGSGLDNIGVYSQVAGGTGKNVGYYARAYNATAGSNIGFYSYVTSASTYNIGGYFGFAGVESLNTSAALIADNGALTDSIFLARDNSSTIFSIIDGGNVGIGTTSPSQKLHLNNGTFLVDNPSSPTLAGAYNTSGVAVDVYVSGKYAYVADGDSGLQIIDVSNQSMPTLVSTLDTSGSAYDVYVSGKYAYVADFGDGLKIIDVSDPYSPTLVGSYNTSGSSYGIYVSGKYAYVADSESGLQIIDVSNPANPTLSGTYLDASGVTFGVYVTGKYAYISNGTAGLQIINVSNPASPTLAGTYNTPETAFDVYVSGKYAYVADYLSGLQIINIASSTAPTLAGTYNTGSFAFDVSVGGKYAYVADGSSGLNIIDVSSTTAPTLVGAYNTSSSASGVYVVGKNVYVADEYSGLNIIDVKGADIYSILAGNIKTGDLTIDENGDVGNNFYIRNGLNVGVGGVMTDGTLSVGSTSYFGSNVGLATTTPLARLTVGSSTPIYLTSDQYYNSTYISGQLEVGGSATSTFAGYIDVKGAATATSTFTGNVRVLGTLQSGDLAFANAFRFTEDPMPINGTLQEGTQSLKLKNQRGEDILTIDENGNLTVSGSLQSLAISPQQADSGQLIAESLSWILEQFKSLVVTAKEFIADKITGKQICVEDVCVDRNQFKELLDKNGIGLPADGAWQSAPAEEVIPPADETAVAGELPAEPAPTVE